MKQMDLQTIKLCLEMRSSDLLFQQHLNTKMSINIFCIILQMGLNILGLGLALFGINISLYFLMAIICLLFVVLFNGYVSDKMWKSCSKRLSYEFNHAFEIIANIEDPDKVLEILKSYSTEPDKKKLK